MTLRNSGIGIDLGGTFIKAARVSGEGRILEQIRRPTQPESGPEGVADRICDMVKKLVAADPCSGVGVGIPGVTTAEGLVVIAPNLDWEDVPFQDMLRSRIDLPVAVDNDANVAALAEARVGAGMGCDALVLVTLGTGIGGGVVLGGRIHHGASHSAGEVGHMCVLPDGPPCGCGNLGCLEALTSGPAMVRMVQEGIASGNPCGIEGDITPETLCAEAGRGDPLCGQAVAQAGKFLGVAIANLINVLSPDVVAIGGGISAAGDILMSPILESVRAHTLKGLLEHTRILPATLGNDAGSLGAAFLVL